MTRIQLSKKERKKLKQSLGMIIRSKRKALNWSQEDLGDEAGIHRTYIGALERGERNVSIEILGVLASTLNCEIGDLMPMKSEYKSDLFQ